VGARLVDRHTAEAGGEILTRQGLAANWARVSSELKCTCISHYVQNRGGEEKVNIGIFTFFCAKKCTNW
jgi:hypothetical protein